jgi:hypothetical protein
MRRPPAPASQAEATRWLQDPTAWHSNVHPAAFHVNVPYDGQLTYARLLHAAIEEHFPDALQLTAQAVMGVLRCAVEVLVQRHDGTVFRDAARIGRACADRAASKGATALVALYTRGTYRVYVRYTRVCQVRGSRSLTLT